MGFWEGFTVGFVVGGLGVAFVAFCLWLNSAPCDETDEHAEHPGV